MKPEKLLLKEKATAYGLQSLSDKELFTLLNYKGEPKDFFTSPQYNAMKEAVRRYETAPQIKITKSQDAFKRLSFLEGLDHEQFWCIFLNRRNVIIKDSFISKGGMNGTVVDVRIILKEAIQLKAHGIILAHNHPSGDPRPSSEDMSITKRFKEAAKLMDITLLDHIIIGDNTFCSFADEGHI